MWRAAAALRAPGAASGLSWGKGARVAERGSRGAMGRRPRMGSGQTGNTPPWGERGGRACTSGSPNTGPAATIPAPHAWRQHPSMGCTHCLRRRGTAQETEPVIQTNAVLPAARRFLSWAAGARVTAKQVAYGAERAMANQGTSWRTDQSIIAGRRVRAQSTLPFYVQPRKTSQNPLSGDPP
jgi:hypothetical protein